MNSQRSTYAPAQSSKPKSSHALKNLPSKIWADFGPDLGILQTSAQVTAHYTPDSLIGRQIIGCVNLGEKNIAGFKSQFLLIGLSDEKDRICLLSVDPNVPNGQKAH